MPRTWIPSPIPLFTYQFFKDCVWPFLDSNTRYSVNSTMLVSLHCILPGAILAVPTHPSPGQVVQLSHTVDALF